MLCQIAPGQPVFQLQATQALAQAAEWGGKTPHSLSNLCGGWFASMLPRDLGALCWSSGGFLSPVCGQLLPSCSATALPCERTVFTQIISLCLQMFSPNSTKPPLPSPSFRKNPLMASQLCRACSWSSASSPRPQAASYKSLRLEVPEESPLGSRGCSWWLLSRPGLTAPAAPRGLPSYGLRHVGRFSLTEDWRRFLTVRAGRRRLAKRW